MMMLTTNAPVSLVSDEDGVSHHIYTLMYVLVRSARISFSGLVLIQHPSPVPRTIILCSI